MVVPDAGETLDLEDLKRAGLRVTAPRLAVLAAVRQGGHPTVEELAASARGRLGTVSTQAVYDVLAALATADLVRRIEPPGGPARFEARVGDNHHHLLCRACGALQDVDCAVGHGPCLELPDVHGYAVDEVEVIFKGLCPTCGAAVDARAGNRSGERSDAAWPWAQERRPPSGRDDLAPA